VTTFGWGGAWAELRAVDTPELAPLPAGTNVGEASALPVAGVTALRALRALGSVLGRRVLVTGASGGVGHFAVQLARRAGAHVVASVGSEARGEGLRSLGAHEVVVALDDAVEPFHGVIENVGGTLLTRAFDRLARGGKLVSVGNVSLEPSTFDLETLRLLGGDRLLEAFAVGPAFGPDLAYLAALLALRELDASIGWRGSWDRAAEAADALRDRKVRGKAVLDLRGGAR
jgi:NADPH:quinone reductase-like Zn-dependent oxidoreductase